MNLSCTLFISDIKKINLNQKIGRIVFLLMIVLYLITSVNEPIQEKGEWLIYFSKPRSS